jgi:hypothetical protein
VVEPVSLNRFYCLKCQSYGYAYQWHLERGLA